MRYIACRGNDGAEEGTKPGGPKGYIDVLGTVLALTPPARRASERNDGAEEGTKPGGAQEENDMLGTVLALTPPARRASDRHDFATIDFSGSGVRYIACRGPYFLVSPRK